MILFPWGFFFPPSAFFNLTTLLRAGTVTAFSSDITSGFFGDVVMQNVSFVWRSTPYFAEYGLLRPSVNSYLLLPDHGSAASFLLWHMVTTPPDFDQVLRIQAPGFVFPSGRNWPLMVQFPSMPNDYKWRLVVGQSYDGVLNGTSTLSFRVLSNIYPSPSQFNGDGRTDFVQYCVVPSRPKWALCP